MRRPTPRSTVRTAHPGARPPTPEQPPRPAVPPDDRPGRDHDEVPAPVAAGSAGQHPEKLVACAQARSLTGRTREDGQLVAEQEVLRDQGAAVADGRAEHGDEEEQTLDHRGP